ncbi:hypothetical protein ACFZDG_18245 [Kitasatospora xanthocidica]|uniref:hypothetical protein n=1 Tax=Kitasatospora xanthocidica TaxID=83382 RepID=UPI0036F17918
MSQPTVISDITTVTGVADVVIDDTALWVSPGQTPAGRYWTLFTAADNRLAGVVVEHNGLYEAVIRQSVASTATAQDAALLLVAALHAPNPKGSE